MSNKTKKLDRFIKVLPFILIIPTALLSIFVVTFAIDFPTYLGTEKSWLNTAQILNGILTPILTFASIVLIALTWLTTKKEMESTRAQLEEQILYQQRKDDLDILSRQSLYLNEKMIKKQKVFDLYNNAANDELFNFLEGLYQNSNVRLLEFYKSIGFNYEEAQSSINDFAEQLYFKLYPIELSQKELVFTGTHISACYGLNFNKCDYLNDIIRHQSYKVKNIFFDVFSAIYMKNLFSNQYVNSTMLLLKKIHHTESDYKKELIEEFKVIYDLELAKRLIQFSDDIPDNFFD